MYDHVSLRAASLAREGTGPMPQLNHTILLHSAQYGCQEIEFNIRKNKPIFLLRGLASWSAVVVGRFGSNLVGFFRMSTNLVVSEWSVVCFRSGEMQRRN